MKKKKRRKANTYTVMLIPDRPGDRIKQYRLRFRGLRIALLLIVFGLCAGVGYCMLLTARYQEQAGERSEILLQMEQLETTRSALEKQNREYADQIAILSDTIQEKVARE